MPNAPRDTGLQVIHYVGATITGSALAAAFVGELPVGSVITDLDITVVTPFGAGVNLEFAATPTGPSLVTFGVNAAGKLKLVNALTPLPVSAYGRGGQFYARLTGAAAPGGLAFVVLSFAPKIG